MSFEIIPKSLDLTDNELKFEIFIKGGEKDYNGKVFSMTPEELDEMILKLKKVRILICGIEAAGKANVQATDKIDQSEEATVVRNILIEDLRKQLPEEKKEETPA